VNLGSVTLLFILLIKNNISTYIFIKIDINQEFIYILTNNIGMTRVKPIRSNLGKYLSFIQQLRLFNRIEPEDLDRFFVNIQVENYSKGEIHNFNPENHSKLYIVYKGIIKILKSSHEGTENVLSLFQEGDAITPMYLSPYYDVSAGFLSDTTLFAFKEKDVIMFAQKNHQFSNNNLKYLAECVQSLMVQKAVLHLKTSKERVGWYLTQTRINETFELNFPKAAVSSYLGITPESFSRALNSLTNDGVYVNKNKIALNSGDELCQYCDRVTGSNCIDFQSEKCTHY
jgi:CRP/FNR family transcriptional regulator